MTDPLCVNVTPHSEPCLHLEGTHNQEGGRCAVCACPGYQAPSDAEPGAPWAKNPDVLQWDHPDGSTIAPRHGRWAVWGSAGYAGDGYSTWQEAAAAALANPAVTVTHAPPQEHRKPGPAHYTATPIDPIDVIDAWELGFNLGNVIKYVARCERKGDPLGDLRKALWYLEHEIERRQK